MELTPSAWRTCRVLANARRLLLLANVIRRGPLTVSHAAHLTHVPECTATLGLRALQSRGLLTSVRNSRWVRYSASPDPLVSHADSFLTITSRAIAQGETPAVLVNAFTAFTHPRRIRIVQALATAPLTNEQISVRCEISRPALRRHLAKLTRRGVIAADDKHRWHLVPPPFPLLRDLVRIVLAEQHPHTPSENRSVPAVAPTPNKRRPARRTLAAAAKPVYTLPP